MTMTMSAADRSKSKPPRPCSEYNIFFQLERAYILQVLLHAGPTLDLDPPGAAFHPLQPTYAGLPPLPRRYAALVLPYDWHLPGKERRRRRPHRASHGAIGFHELSRRIAAAWKDAGEDVRAYCARVGAVGMARYRAALREWKRGEGPSGGLVGNSQPPAMATIGTGDLSMRMSEAEAIASNEVKAKLQGVLVTAPSQEAAVADMNQALDHDIILDTFIQMVDKKMIAQDAQQELLQSRPSLPSTNVPSPVDIYFQRQASDGDGKEETQSKRNPSQTAAASVIAPVDITDNEIFDMWHSINDYDLVSNTQESNHNGAGHGKTTAMPLPSASGLVQAMQRMKAALEQQKLELDGMTQGVRRRSVAARSA